MVHLTYGCDKFESLNIELPPTRELDGARHSIPRHHFSSRDDDEVLVAQQLHLKGHIIVSGGIYEGNQHDATGCIACAG